MLMLVKARIEANAAQFTASERKLAAAILSDYPFAGLVSIQELASRSDVSAPSISRFVAKIGLSGYQAFQRDLIAELKEGQRSPVEVHATGKRIEGGYLAEFMARATQQMAIAAEAITEEQFARICTLLADPKRNIYLLGGRISDVIARYLSFHLRQVRQGILHLSPVSETWPEPLLSMTSRDILFVADFRRYQSDLAALCRQAAEQRGAKIILMTDKWLSPIARDAAEVLPVPIASGTLWDTYTPALAVTEAIVTRIADDNWDQTRDRIKAWDALRITGKECGS